jgi:hypothetical protein
MRSPPSSPKMGDASTTRRSHFRLPPPLSQGIRQPKGTLSPMDDDSRRTSGDANDNASTPSVAPAAIPPDEYARRYARITAPGVLDALRAELAERYGSRKAADTRIGGVWEQAMQSKTFPREGEPLVPWLVDRADAVRRRESRHTAKWNAMTENVDALDDAGSPDDRESLPPELVEVKRVAEEVAAARPMDGRAYAMMKDHYLKDEPVRAVANKWGVPEGGYYDQTERFSACVRKRLARPSTIAMLLIGFAVGYLLHHPPRRDDRPTTPPVAVAPTPPTPEAPDLHAIAAAFRADGLAACARAKWDVCYAKLSDATQVDPTLATDPAVTKAKEDAAREMAKSMDRKGPAPDDSKAPPRGARP